MTEGLRCLPPNGTASDTLFIAASRLPGPWNALGSVVMKWDATKAPEARGQRPPGKSGDECPRGNDSLCALPPRDAERSLPGGRVRIRWSGASLPLDLLQVTELSDPAGPSMDAHSREHRTLRPERLAHASYLVKASRMARLRARSSWGASLWVTHRCRSSMRMDRPASL